MSDAPVVTGSGRAPSAVQPGLIDRRDLVAALDRAVRKQVTFISAPAGSGKTSLLRAWADRPGQERRIAFLSVRPGQQDGQLFWLALLDAIRAATGTDGGADPPAAPAFNGGPMVDKVLSELAVPCGPLVIVIDDLHELTSAEALGQLTELLANLPPSLHVIVATRRNPPLRLHRLRLTGELAEIRAAQLLFTKDETRELLATAGMALSEHTTAMLHQRTEGWAAGLRLAMLSLMGRTDPERFVADFSGSDRTVAEYLMAEMLERQPPEVRRLLLRTSVLDRVNGELADLLSGGTGSERILLDLEDANAFVLSLDPDRTWFRYHRMFSDLLRLELRRTLPGDIPLLHRLAARWLCEHAQTLDAIRHLQAVGGWGEAASLLTDHALGLTLDGQARTVTALLRSFPAQARADSPGLALVDALADLDQFRLDQADAHLQAAKSYAVTAPPDRRHRLQMTIASLDILSARLRGHFDGVFEHVGALLTPTTDLSNADVALSSDLRALALLNLGVAEGWSLQMADSERHLLAGASLARSNRRPYLEVACLVHLGFASTIKSFALARRRCEEAIALAAERGWDADPVIAPALATLAGVLIWTGEFDQGARWLDHAIRATRSSCEPAVQLLVRLISATLSVARGHHREALAEFATAKRIQERMPEENALVAWMTEWTVASQARLGMIGDARATLDALDDRQAAPAEIGNADAMIRLTKGDPAGAHRSLRHVLDGTATANPYLTRIEAHLLDALACRDLGDERAAREAIEHALKLAEPDRLILPFAMTGAWRLLEALPSQDTSHAALITDILDSIRGGGPDRTPPAPARELSPSELRVLRYLPTNLTRPEIAEQLSVSTNTISTHIRRIYAKLDTTDRATTVRRARELRLLSGGRI